MSIVGHGQNVSS